MRYYSEATVNGIIHDMYQGNHIPKATDYPSIEIPESPWHTGAPTEQGWYLLKVMHEDEIVYYANLLENNTDLQWHYAMYGKIIAYKEIKP